MHPSFFSSLIDLEQMVLIQEQKVYTPDMLLDTSDVSIDYEDMRIPMRKVGSFSDLIRLRAFLLERELGFFSQGSPLQEYYNDNRILSVLIREVFPRLTPHVIGYADRITPGPKARIPNEEELREKFLGVDDLTEFKKPKLTSKISPFDLDISEQTDPCLFVGSSVYSTKFSRKDTRASIRLRLGRSSIPLSLQYMHSLSREEEAIDTSLRRGLKLDDPSSDTSDELALEAEREQLRREFIEADYPSLGFSFDKSMDGSRFLVSIGLPNFALALGANLCMPYANTRVMQHVYSSGYRGLVSSVEGKAFVQFDGIHPFVGARNHHNGYYPLCYDSPQRSSGLSGQEAETDYMVNVFLTSRNTVMYGFREDAHLRPHHSSRSIIAEFPHRLRTRSWCRRKGFDITNE